MGLEIGIVGLPNAGKSTLFNALTRAGAAVASYPFTTIEPNVGVVPVADPRLEAIAALVQPEQVIPTTARFVDIAGLVKGAHRGEGLGNQFLGHIRNVDAVLVVLRCFEAADIPHVANQLDPVADLETLDTELVLADLATVDRRLEKTRPAARAHPREHAHELEALERLRDHLNRGQPARHSALPEADRDLAEELGLLTAKPCAYVANVAETDLPDGGALVSRLAQRAQSDGVPLVTVCARLEMELLELSPEEANAYRAELGLTEHGLQRVVQVGYDLLDLITFFTTAGGIVQAWTVHRGTPAPVAAGKIHTDMERGFIRAEVIHYEDLLADGSLAHVREHGHLRLEGRDYLIQDGDVVQFRFAV